MKAVQIDYVRKMIAKALNHKEYPQSVDDVIDSFPGAVEDMTFQSHYDSLARTNKINDQKVHLLLEVIEELG